MKMIDNKTLSLMADIIGDIEQTEEWTELQMNDPGIKDADSRLGHALDRAKNYLPKALYNELADAHCGVISAYSDVAILYGMRVAAVIQAVTANPSEITRFWLERK